MIELIPPEVAIRMLPRFERKGHSVWHFQSPKRPNKTVCGIIVADGRGHKNRNPGSISLSRYRQRWERKNTEELEKRDTLCAACLGPLEVAEKKRQQELL